MAKLLPVAFKEAVHTRLLQRKTVKQIAEELNEPEQRVRDCVNTHFPELKVRAPSGLRNARAK